MKFIYLTFILSLTYLVLSCSNDKPKAEKLLINCTIQTMDSSDPVAKAMAIRDGSILAVGSAREIHTYKGPNTEIIDAGDTYVMPAFIEGHGHFSGLGNALLSLNLLGVSSWQEVLDTLTTVVEKAPDGHWITGRGWHQEKWNQLPEQTVDGYPTNTALNRIAPHHPVLLNHASGHALIANQKAIELAGIDPSRPDPKGGRIVRNVSGEMTGVFEDNAETLVRNALDKHRASRSEEVRYREWLHKVQRAEEACYKHGITSFHDAGVSMEEIRWYQRAYEADELNMRTYVMLGLPPDSLRKYGNKFPIIDAYDGRFTVRSVKAYVDGALGSFGAWLLEPYADKPNHFGHNVTPLSRLDTIAQWCLEHNMQFCTHAIGDRANREMLDLYAKYYKQADGKDLRWRIEHAQHISKQDIPRFGDLGVMASIQAIHCTSDAAFFEKRLGTERSAEEAYPWNTLWETGAVVGNGTDCPVESVDPLPCLFASVTRKRQPDGRAYYPTLAMTRAQALASYTVNNAYMAFQEEQIGQLKTGHRADFILLSKNIKNCSPEDILNTQIIATYQNGEPVYMQQ